MKNNFQWEKEKKISIFVFDFKAIEKKGRWKKPEEFYHEQLIK